MADEIISELENPVNRLAARDAASQEQTAPEHQEQAELKPEEREAQKPQEQVAPEPQEQAEPKPQEQETPKPQEQAVPEAKVECSAGTLPPDAKEHKHHHLSILSTGIEAYAQQSEESMSETAKALLHKFEDEETVSEEP